MEQNSGEKKKTPSVVTVGLGWPEASQEQNSGEKRKTLLYVPEFWYGRGQFSGEK